MVHVCRAILNVCMPYTSRDEITTAVQASVQRCIDREVDAESVVLHLDFICFFVVTWLKPRLSSYYSDLTEHDIESQLETVRRGGPPLDILIRTSGVRRLSDFLLWQVGFYFIFCLFPCCDQTAHDTFAR